MYDVLQLSSLLVLLEISGVDSVDFELTKLPLIITYGNSTACVYQLNWKPPSNVGPLEKGALAQ